MLALVQAADILADRVSTRSSAGNDGVTASPSRVLSPSGTVGVMSPSERYGLSPSKEDIIAQVREREREREREKKEREEWRDSIRARFPFHPASARVVQWVSGRQSVVALTGSVGAQRVALEKHRKLLETQLAKLGESLTG